MAGTAINLPRPQLHFLDWMLDNHAPTPAHRAAYVAGYRIYRRAIQEGPEPGTYVAFHETVTAGRKIIRCTCNDYTRPSTPRTVYPLRPTQPLCAHTAAVWFVLFERKFIFEGHHEGTTGQFTYCNRCGHHRYSLLPGWYRYLSGKRACPDCRQKELENVSDHAARTQPNPT